MRAGRRKSDRRGPYGGARKEATGPDQLEVIPRVESPASRSMKFFLSPRYTGLCSRRVALSFSRRASHTRASAECVGEERGLHVYVLALPCPPPLLLSLFFLSLFRPPSLIAPYPPPRAERGIRALIRANYTGGSQFNFARRGKHVPRARPPHGAAKYDVSIVDPPSVTPIAGGEFRETRKRTRGSCDYV